MNRSARRCGAALPGITPVISPQRFGRRTCCLQDWRKALRKHRDSDIRQMRNSAPLRIWTRIFRKNRTAALRWAEPLRNDGFSSAYERTTASRLTANRKTRRLSTLFPGLTELRGRQAGVPLKEAGKIQRVAIPNGCCNLLDIQVGAQHQRLCVFQAQRDDIRLR